MRVAIIPARGGSKRIPKKNIKNFAGFPMIYYAINTAIESNLFSRIIVTTDDEEIVKIAKGLGAEIPFIRNKDLSDDFTPTVPVIADCLSQIDKDNLIEEVCCIYPCVPFLTANDLLESYKIFSNNKNCYCFPVIEFPSPIQRALKLENNAKLKSINEGNELTRTQDLEPIYYDAGQFYWGSVKTWFENDILHSDAYGFIVEGSRFIDIDTQSDWERALLMKEIINKR